MDRIADNGSIHGAAPAILLLYHNAFGGEEMKKAMVYVLALTLAFSVLLAGCGETRGTDDRTTAPSATPQQTMIPDTTMPDPRDGEVRDRDGIITDGDTGGDTALPGNGVNSGTASGGNNGASNAKGMMPDAKR